MAVSVGSIIRKILPNKRFVAVLIGTVMLGFGGLSFFDIPVFSGIILKPVAVVLAVFAALYGSAVGSVSGVAGSLLADLMMGTPLRPLWIICAGVTGFIIGLFPLMTSGRLRQGRFPVRDIIIFIFLSLTGYLAGYAAALLAGKVLAGALPVGPAQRFAVFGSVHAVLTAIFGTAAILVVARQRRRNLEMRVLYTPKPWSGHRHPGGLKKKT